MRRVLMFRSILGLTFGSILGLTFGSIFGLTFGMMTVLGSSYAYAQVPQFQQVCELEMLKDPKLTLADMVAKSEAKAKAWKPDVIVAPSPTRRWARSTRPASPKPGT